jgi:hypothetical protein
MGNKRVNTLIKKDKVESYEYNVVKKKSPNIRSSSNDIVLFTFDPLGFIIMGPSICSEIVLQTKNIPSTDDYFYYIDQPEEIWNEVAFVP